MSVLQFPRGTIKDIRTDEFDRRIMRDALTKYSKDLEASSKAREKLGLDTDDEETRIAVIEGDGGFGIGLYTRLLETGEAPAGSNPSDYKGDQIGFADQIEEESEERKAERAREREIFESNCAEVRDGLLGESIFPEGIYADELLKLVRALKTEERGEVYAWLQRDKTADPQPATPLPALRVRERIREFLLTEDEVSHYVDNGPWIIDEKKWEETDTPYWFAEYEDPKNAPEGTATVDTERFADEDAAFRRVAWLNKEDEARWANEPQRVAVPPDETTEPSATADEPPAKKRGGKKAAATEDA